jgi:hypothetical protein
MTKKTRIAGVAIIIALLSPPTGITGCDRGTVTSKSNNGAVTKLCIRTGDGNVVCDNFKKGSVDGCKQGTRWPDCAPKYQRPEE